MFKIYKFGGSILKKADDVRLIASVIKDEKSINVFSAFFGITDALIKVSNLAKGGMKEYEMQLEFIENFHINICEALGIETDFVAKSFLTIKNILAAVEQIKDLSPKILDKIIGYGELLSSHIVASFTKIKYVDAREIIKTDANYGKAKVEFTLTKELVKKSFKKNEQYIIAGFISSDLENIPTTLGRNGSDYSAALLASLLDANEITIWKDVDGLSTADPKIVGNALPINKISYKEMAELSYFGNKIISLQALQPAIDKNIKIYLRNIYDIKNEGTLISGETNENFIIKGISRINNVVLVSVSGLAMVGISGFSKRVFSSLSQVNVSVIFMAQSSSETTICFGIKQDDLEKVKIALKDEFNDELLINAKQQQSIIAIAGYGMANTPGISAKIFTALARAKINIVAIAQDFNEMNISFCVNNEVSDLAIKVIHNYIFEEKQIFCLVAGRGVVGSAVIKMIEENKSLGKKFKIVGVCNSKEYNGEPYKNYGEIIEKFKKNNYCESALIDCTSSENLLENYKLFIENDFNIITPNKKANTLSIDKFDELKKVFEKNKKYFFYEANVGAGLPIISTIKSLLDCGDEITKIEGIFSGTLSYIFNNLDQNKKFSEIVLEAKEKGFTEPDPNDDLCGADVGRKLLILARLLGLKIELKDVKIQSLVGISDDEILKMFLEAKEKNSVLRYIGSIVNGVCSAKIEIIANTDSLSSTQYTDNIIAITSKYYDKTPLVIKGPGAGAEVTASGIVGDLIKLYDKLF